MRTIPQPNANDRFKQRAGRSTWGGILAAVAVHVLVFAFAPSMEVTNQGASAAEVELVPVDPVIPPEPPEIAEIEQPGVPIVSDVDPRITIPDNSQLFDEPGPLPAPPATGADAASRIDAFMPRDVDPVLRNTRHVQRLLEQSYPPTLRDAGVGGEVRVWFYIDGSGVVRETRLSASSGYDALDRAALAIADEMEFGPALLRGRAVPVWVAIPIVFTAR